MRLLAVVAEFAAESLGNDQRHRRGDVVGRYAHVGEARQCLRRVVGVQRGEYQVAGLRRLDGDLGRFQIPYLADHDHVRILSQKGAQRVGEGEPDLRIDVDLIDAGHVDLGRIFRCRDVALRRIEDIEAGIERDGLSRTGRSGDQNHSIGLGQRIEVELFLLFVVTQRVDAELGAAGVENPQHDLFAIERGAGVDTKVDGASFGDLQLDAAILRNAALGDVHPRHDLDARDDSRREIARRLRHFVENAVHAEADAKHLFVDLEMDVRCAAADRVQQRAVDEAHDRRVVHLLRLRRLHLGVFETDLELLQIALQLAGVPVVVGAFQHLLDGGAELVVLDDDGLGGEPGLELEFVQRRHVHRIGDGDVDAVAALDQRQRVMLGQQLLVDQVGRQELGVEGSQIQHREAELLGAGARHLQRGGNGLVEQYLHQWLVALGGERLGFDSLGLGDDALGQQPTQQAVDGDGRRGRVVDRGW